MNQRYQPGGVLLGIIIGLLVGLGIALAVAIYVTKAPVPFVQKVTPATQTRPEDEAKRNQNWDPNAPLYGKNPASAKDPGVAPPPEAAASAAAARPAGKNAADASDPIGQFAKANVPAAGTAKQPEPAVTKPGDPWIYFLQAGAFRDQDQAEQQRAKLAMLGIETKITEREQAGVTMYRVRMGPFNTLEDINKAKERLDSQGVESAIVRIPR
jgi:cell division protein FtsN